MKRVFPIVAATMVLFGAAAAHAQGTSSGSTATGGASVNSGMPGAAPNGTTPGALGNSTQSLAPSESGTGSGLSAIPIEPDIGVTPGGPGSQSFNPSGTPLPGSDIGSSSSSAGSSSAGSSSSGVSSGAGSSSGG
jgi:hypothetical protein